MTSRSSNRFKSFLAIFGALLFISLPLHALNKVRYKSYDWQVLKTAHFDIYYEKGNRSMAETAAQIAEYASAKISDNLRFDLTHTIPIFLYNGHNDFEDNNLTWEVLSEGVGGFTEPLKNRVVVPFPGSYEEFRHVLTHELTHAFQFNILYGDFWEALIMRPFMYSAPLWFMEGMAEWESLGDDVTSDILLRDAVMNNMLHGIQENDETGNQFFSVYKCGQSFISYIARTYGDKKPGEMLKYFRVSKDMNAVCKSLFAKDVSELSAEWVLDLKKRYLPDIHYQQIWDKKFTFLTHHAEDGSYNNAKPVWSADARQIYYFSDRHLLPEITSMNVDFPEQKRTIIRSGLTVNFEELHANDNKMSVSRDGRYLLFISKNGANDRINIYDLKKKRVVRQINPHMDDVMSASFSPDARKIVYAATGNGRTDLWIVDIQGRHLQRLTDDDFFDFLPNWGSDNWIYFVSNRGKSIWSKQHDIFRISPDTKKIEIVVSSPWTSTMPDLSPDGKRLAFVSLRNGIPNIYVRNMTNSDIIRLTDVIGAAYDPVWSTNSRKLAFAFYQRMGQDIVLIDADRTTTQFSNTFEGPFATSTNYLRQFPGTAWDRRNERNSPARLIVTPDYVNFTFGYSYYYDLVGAGEVLVSDVQGNHQAALSVSFLTKSNDFNYNLFYLYQKYRLNIGGGLYSQKDYYVKSIDVNYNINTYYLKQTGGYLDFLYPFSRFFTAEMRATLQNYNLFLSSVNTSSNINKNVLGPVFLLYYDNSVWTGSYNTRGSQFLLQFEYAINADGSFWSYQRLVIDFRHYVPMFLNSSFASRIVFASIWGRDAVYQPFYIGGIDSVRGYFYDVFSSVNMTLIKLEYRFPFIVLLRLGWPLPMAIRAIDGVFFWDFGAVWDNASKTSFAHISNDTLYFDTLKSGVGIGLRLNLYYFKFMFDYATPFTGNDIRPFDNWIGYFSIGYDF